MAMEAEVMTERLEGAHDVERRARTERRGRDRRKPGNRINREAPTHSLIKVIGAFGVAIMTAVATLTVLAGQMLDLEIPGIALTLQGVLLGSSILLIAIGSIEQRLIEIRLELMMLNGGRRAGDDRRQGLRRRAGDDPAAPPEPEPAAGPSA
ncbi:hypothetical protein [Brevundimonas sp.]|uniref:hypothetical protein n=1 Tax=Brevundimonas sp. TaxID=1871086 RepID=UPI002D32260F|nr:hypothetical protein [Brevundimonas sp.]HYD27282.1 hypothetical protein [Brevundimonas sp.]